MNLETMKSKYIWKRQIHFSNDPGDVIFKTRFGFLAFDAPLLTYYASLRSKQHKTYHLRRIVDACPSFFLTQDGDREFLGYAKKGQAGLLIAVSRPHLKRLAPANAFKPKPKF